MKVSEYGLWAMISWIYNEAKRKNQVTKMVRLLRVLGILGVIGGCIA